MKKMIVVFALLLLIGILTACTGAPDTENIEPPPAEIEVSVPGETPPNIATEGVTSANVQVHFGSEEFLAQFESYDEFIELDGAEYPRIIITTDIPILGFRFVELNALAIGEDDALASPTVLYYQEQLQPGTPFVTMWRPQEVIPQRGILFTDEENQQRLFAIHQSDSDSTPFLWEFEIAALEYIELSPRTDVIGILETSEHSWIEIIVFTDLHWSEELEESVWTEPQTLSQESAERVYEILSTMEAIEVLTPFHNESQRGDSMFRISIVYASGEIEDIFSTEIGTHFFRLTGTHGSHGDPGFIIGMSETLFEILTAYF